MSSFVTTGFFEVISGVIQTIESRLKVWLVRRYRERTERNMIMASIIGDAAVDLGNGLIHVANGLNPMATLIRLGGLQFSLRSLKI
jgi:hypothetical protein